jgi:hypothetical protein
MRYPTQDRRRTRSVKRQEATRLQLAHVAGEFDLGLCAVSDTDGNLVASSTEGLPVQGEVAEVVALLGTLQDKRRFGDCVARHAERTLVRRLEREGVDVGASRLVTVREFHAQGQRLYLTAVGEPNTMREVGIYRAILGIRRIWQQTERQAA